MSDKRFSIKKLLLYVVVCAILVAGICGAIYVVEYYHASDESLAMINDPLTTTETTETDNKVTINTDIKNQIAFVPDNPVAGFIFYPGAKIQYEAYAPLMKALSERNILCIIVHMPFNLAVLDVDAADGIIEEYPQVTNWFIGGHSLGGAIAAKYVAKHTDEFKGIIFLGSYTTTDLSKTGLAALSVSCTEDKILNTDNFDLHWADMPTKLTEVSIDGGNHSYFGDYGEQSGDGTATISRSQQQTITADSIKDFIDSVIN